jgi:U32 family peptidase
MINKNKKQKLKKQILLAPVGNWEMLITTIDSGCDAVYLGIKGINMRYRTKNFEINELKKIVDFAHKHNVEVYLTVNIICFNKELKKIKKVLIEAKKTKIDAIICWDFGVIKLCKELNLNIHLSTQASVSNIEAIKEYYKLGIKRFILARECSLEDIKEIKKQTKKIDKTIEIEVFIHGAMCVALSGRCFMSQFLYGNNTSANRGKCIQPCRRKYIIKDPETNKELEVHNNYIISPKDLCTIPFIEKILDSGVDVLKIEGRARSPEYIKEVVSAYRKIIDIYFENKNRINNKLKSELLTKLKTVYNRDFSNGFYLGKPINEWTNQYGSKASKKKTYIGKIIKLFKKINVAEIKIESNNINIDDNILIIGKVGVIEQQVFSLQLDVNKSIKSAKKGDIVALKLNENNKIPKIGDKIYLLENI